jgi:cold shock CspA family protein
MAKSKETFSKKDKEKKRTQHRMEKQKRKEERKANSMKGKGLSEMMAFIDENGNLSDTPPDPRLRKVINLEDIQIGVPKREDIPETERTGTVIFFDQEKGFGFVNDQQTNERIFIHANNLENPVKISDTVSFMIEPGPRGPVGVQVKKIG